MAITYKGSNKSLSHLYVYDSSAATYSANLAGTAAHDLFPDDATVDDIIYFGATEKFSDLYFNIGTSLVADAITIVWEYWNAYAGSWQTLTVTDNTNSFQTAGANTVLFGVPVRWGMGYGSNDPKPNNITSKFWVRARITAVTNLTEGGANQTTAIYGKLAKLVVTGTYADLMPSLYSADVAGGWNVVLRQIMFDNFGYYYGLLVPVDIGDGSTATTVTLKNDVVELMDGAVIGDMANSNMTINDCFFIVHSCCGTPLYALKNNFGTVTRIGWMNHNNDYPGNGGSSPYNNSLFSMSATIQGRAQRWGTGYSPAYWSGTGATNRDLALNLSQGWGYGASLGGTTDNVVTNVGFVPVGSNRYIAHNLKTYSTGHIVGTNGSFATHIILDNVIAPNSDVTNPAKFNAYSCANNNFYIVYSFNVKVIDKQGNPIIGATVTIQNSQNTQNYGFNYTTGADNSGPFTTDENGLTQTTLLIWYKHYNSTRTGNWKDCDTAVDYSPHTITISKPGYQTKTLKLTIDRKREEVEVLEKEVPIFIGKGKVLVNVDPKNSQNNILV